MSSRGLQGLRLFPTRFTACSIVATSQSHQKVLSPTIPHWGLLRLAAWVAWRNTTRRGTTDAHDAAAEAIRSPSRSSAIGLSMSTAAWCALHARRRPRAKSVSPRSPASLGELRELKPQAGRPEAQCHCLGTVGSTRLALRTLVHRQERAASCAAVRCKFSNHVTNRSVQ